MYDDESVIDKLQKSVQNINETLKDFKIISRRRNAF